MKSDPPDAAMDAQIAFRRMAHSDVLESEIRTRVAWLEQFYGDIGGGVVRGVRALRYLADLSCGPGS